MMILVFTCILQLARGVEVKSYLTPYQNTHDGWLQTEPDKFVQSSGGEYCAPNGEKWHYGLTVVQCKAECLKVPNCVAANYFPAARSACWASTVCSETFKSTTGGTSYRILGVNHVFTGMVSQHDNGKEDRRWKFYLGTASGMVCNRGGWTGYQNSLDGNLDFSCGSNEAIATVASFDDAATRDRSWNFKCCNVESNGEFKIGPIRTTGWINSFDKEMDAKCGSQEVLVGVISTHADRHEDRMWKLKCGALLDGPAAPQQTWISAQLLPPASSGDMNGWDAVMEFESPRNYVISGMRGDHHNGFEDRRYAFYYTTGRGMTCEPKTWSGWANAFDGVLDVKCGTDEVMSGLKSEHDNGYEDRRWAYKCCKLDGHKYKIQSTYTTGWVNDWDAVFDWTCGASEVLVGLYSEHARGYEDRRWKFTCASVQEQQAITRVLNSGKSCKANCSQGKCDWCGIGLCCKKGETDAAGDCDGSFGGDGEHQCVPEPETRKISLNKGISRWGSTKTVNLGNPHKISRVRVSGGNVGSEVKVDSTVCGTITDTAETVLDCILAGSKVKAAGSWNMAIEVFGSTIASSPGGCEFEDPNTVGGTHWAPRGFSSAGECVNWCYTFSRYRTGCEYRTSGACILYTAALLGHTPNSGKTCWSFVDFDTYIAHHSNDLHANLNEWKGLLDFTPGSGKVLTGIAGDHDNSQEDRVYGLYTAEVGGVWDKAVQHATPQGWQSSWSEYDGEYVFQCPPMQALVGLKSEYSPIGHRDRQWKSRCGKFDEKIKLVEERWSGWLNDCDDPLNGMCGGYEVLIGTESMHDNGKEDRRWKIGCAKVSDRFPHFDPILLKSTQPSITITRANWMSAVEDNKSLAELSIPGTHDSGSSMYFTPVLTKYVKTQDFEMRTQLEMGVRIFDIRVTHNVNRLHIVHGDVKMERSINGAVYDFEDAFVKTAELFLQQNPSECIIAMMKQEKDPEDNSREFKDTWQMYIDMAPNMWLWSNKVPTLGDCRGKVWVITTSGNIKFTKAVPSGQVLVEQNEWEVNDDKLSDFAAGRRRRTENETPRRRTSGVSTEILADGTVVHLNDMAQESLGRTFLNYQMKDAILDMEQDGVKITTNQASDMTLEEAKELQRWAAAYFEDTCTFDITVKGHYYGVYTFDHVDSCSTSFSTPSEPDTAENGFNCGSRFGLQQGLLRTSTGQTVGQLSCANQGFDVSFTKTLGGVRRLEEEEAELPAPTSSTELVAPMSNVPARRIVITLLVGAVIVAAAAAAAGGAVFAINEALDGTDKDAGPSIDITEIDTTTGIGYKLWKILDHHTTKVENNLRLDKMSIQYFSFTDSTCWTAWPCTVEQTSNDIRAYKSLVPNLRGNQLGGIMFDYPDQWQLDQVLCRNWGLLDGTFKDGKCI